VEQIILGKKIGFLSLFLTSKIPFLRYVQTLDVISSVLHREGIGAKKKHAEADHEQSFWNKSLLGYSSRNSFLHQYAFCT